MKQKNIDFDENTILLTETKTKRERLVYFSEFTKKHLKQYIELLDDSSSYFFRKTDNNSYPVLDKKLSYRTVIRLMHKIRDDLGFKKLSSHMIRHSYGTLAYKLNISTLFTKNSMGHSRVEMTERYIHYDIETNKRIYKDFSPMEYYTNKE